jgi:hypothetical protein
MKYSKPEIVPVANAISAIQGVPKGTSGADSLNPHKQTIAAYEADE